MTLPMQTSSTCYICQNISTHMILASTNRFGAPDLDLRPPEMERSTMSWWIQECPYCGYVASDISCATTVTEEWLKSEAYRSCENVTFKFALAEKFYKQYLIAIQEGKHRTAFYAVLHAAWVCDDAHDIDNAIYCRKKALEIWDKVVVRENERETFSLIRADLLRRSEQFDLLITEYKKKKFSDELLDKIVAFQIEKAKQKDTACYTVAHVK